MVHLLGFQVRVIVGVYYREGGVSVCQCVGV